MDEPLARFPTTLPSDDVVLKVSQAGDTGECVHEWEQRGASIEFYENGIKVPFVYELCVKCNRIQEVKR